MRELKAFGKIVLNPGESGTLTLTSRHFSHFVLTEGRFVLRGDAFMIKAAACGRDIRLTAPVQGYHQPAPPSLY